MKDMLTIVLLGLFGYASKYVMESLSTSFSERMDVKTAPTIVANDQELDLGETARVTVLNGEITQIIDEKGIATLDSAQGITAVSAISPDGLTASASFRANRLSDPLVHHYLPFIYGGCQKEGTFDENQDYTSQTFKYGHVRGSLQVSPAVLRRHSYGETPCVLSDDAWHSIDVWVGEKNGPWNWLFSTVDIPTFNVQFAPLEFDRRWKAVHPNAYLLEPPGLFSADVITSGSMCYYHRLLSEPTVVHDLNGKMYPARSVGGSVPLGLKLVVRIRERWQNVKPDNSLGAMMHYSWHIDSVYATLEPTTYDKSVVSYDGSASNPYSAQYPQTD